MILNTKGATVRSLVAILCTTVLSLGDTFADVSFNSQEPVSSPQNKAAKIPAEQLDSLVAPIALYPDPLLAQALAASTYPLEIIQLQQWLDKNKGLKDKALADAVAKESWDPSVQALAALPDVVKRLADDIQWTTDLGNAFLAQQGDVMDAVQRMRKKAQDKGNLQSTVAPHRISVKIAQLLAKLSFTPDIEVIVTLLPERFLGPQGEPTCHALLQRFQRLRKRAALGFVHEQMHMLRHDDVSVHAEPERLPDPFQRGIRRLCRLLCWRTSLVGVSS